MMLRFGLTEVERAALEGLTRSAERAEADQARRCCSPSKAGRGRTLGALLGVRADTVLHWRCAYRRGGVEVLRTHCSPGRPAHRGRRALEVLEVILAHPLSPSTPPWTLPRLQQEVERRCGIRLSQPWISRLLRKKGGVRFPPPAPYAAWTPGPPGHRAKRRAPERAQTPGRGRGDRASLRR